MALEHEALTERIIGAAIELHRCLVAKDTHRAHRAIASAAGPQGPRICVICVICVTAIFKWMAGNDLRRDANCRPSPRLRHSVGILRHSVGFAPCEPGSNPRPDDTYDELFESSRFSCPARDDEKDFRLTPASACEGLASKLPVDSRSSTLEYFVVSCFRAWGQVWFLVLSAGRSHAWGQVR